MAIYAEFNTSTSVANDFILLVGKVYLRRLAGTKEVVLSLTQVLSDDHMMLNPQLPLQKD